MSSGFISDYRSSVFVHIVFQSYTFHASWNLFACFIMAYSMKIWNKMAETNMEFKMIGINRI